MQSDRDARIRERAHQIWLDEGKVEGRDSEHWHRAESEIAAEEAATKHTAPAKGKTAKSAASKNDSDKPQSSETKATPARPRAKPAAAETKSANGRSRSRATAD